MPAILSCYTLFRANPRGDIRLLNVATHRCGLLLATWAAINTVDLDDTSPCLWTKGRLGKKTAARGFTVGYYVIYFATDKALAKFVGITANIPSGAEMRRLPQ
jgi:hypothetical protein